MAKINCPECGKIISDLQAKCEYCGFPVGEFTDPSMSESDEISYAVLKEPEQEEIITPSVTVFRNENLPKPEIPRSVTNVETVKKACQPAAPDAAVKKKRAVYAAAAVFALAAAICAGVGISYAVNNSGGNNVENSGGEEVESSLSDRNDPPETKPLKVNQLNVMNIQKNEDGRYLFGLETNEKQPFIAVVSDREAAAKSLTGSVPYYYVDMNDGYGYQEFKNISAEETGSKPESEDENIIDPDRFKIEGYLEGIPYYNENLKNIEVSDEYEDLPFDDATIVTVTVDFECDEKMTGKLFYQVTIQSEDFFYDSYAQSATVIDGKAEQQVISVRAPYGVSDAGIEVYSFYFVESENGDDEPKDVEVTTEKYTVESEENVYYLDFSFSSDLESGSEQNGEILYCWDINRGKNGSESVYGSIPTGDLGIARVSGIKSVKSDNVDEVPVVTIRNAGFIPWKSVSEPVEVI